MEQRRYTIKPEQTEQKEQREISPMNIEPSTPRIEPQPQPAPIPRSYQRSGEFTDEIDRIYELRRGNMANCPACSNIPHNLVVNDDIVITDIIGDSDGTLAFGVYIRLYLTRYFKVGDCVLDTMNDNVANDSFILIEVEGKKDGKEYNKKKCFRLKDMYPEFWDGTYRRSSVDQFGFPGGRDIKLYITYIGPCTKCCKNPINGRPTWKFETPYFNMEKDDQKYIVLSGREIARLFSYLGCVSCESIKDCDDILDDKSGDIPPWATKQSGYEIRE